MTRSAGLPRQGSERGDGSGHGAPSRSRVTEQLTLGAAGQDDGPVECLGLTFAGDDERRAYFLERLREKLRDPEFRKTPGFPIGEDEDILRMSDPPYYTACPNPFLADFVRCYGKPYDPSVPYRVEPFAVDVSEGKTDPLYRAHGYHTKVPHLAIVPPILHYTEPGDLVLDGFAGSGMTGVAAQWCGFAPAAYRRSIELQFDAEGRPPPRWGARRAILNDLSPAATFIAANYNLPFDVDAFAAAARQLLRDLEEELGWMYETRHTDGRIGRIEYTVWSEVFSCPECSAEVVFTREALDPDTKRVREEFPCPHCLAPVTKRRLQRAYESRFDPVLGQAVLTPRRAPVLILYEVGNQRYEKTPDELDIAVLRRIEALPLPAVVPSGALPYMHMTHERARMDNAGVTYTHHFFLPRQSQALGTMWSRVRDLEDARTRAMILFFVEQSIWGMSILNRYKTIMHGKTESSNVNQYLSGVYYVPSQISEVSPWYNLENRLDRLTRRAFSTPIGEDNYSAISTGTCSYMIIPNSSIDYVFTDPPFGENIYYADLNYLVESWHHVRTDAEPEAIVDRAKKKGLEDYRDLMRACLAEYYRVLKPGRWLTMVFHNSHNAVWNAIQEALLGAGFVVADVRTLDKQQGSYRQVTSSAMKQDLVVSAYKPSAELEGRFHLRAGSADDAWGFVQAHLRQLPVFVPTPEGQVEPISERRPFVLYDRLVAFFVQRGIRVPLSAAEFGAGLRERFPERDGMIFLPDQVAEYDRRRLSAREVVQLPLLVTDEATLLQWLREELERKPQTLQELTPRFLREMGGAWSRYERRPELYDLLRFNFLQQRGSPLAAPIVAWLKKSSELRERVRAAEAAGGTTPDGDLQTADPVLLAQARDRWYVPDPNRAQDLEKLRERELLAEFDQYRGFAGRKLKAFRVEAVRAGFRRAWAERDYATILAVADKLPDEVLHEDQKLLMWYDQALTRSGEG